jgi:hypothetical protein
VAGQKVLVFAKGSYEMTSSQGSVTLSYNGVQKDISTIQGSSGHDDAWSLMYEEIPGAGTHDIAVAQANGVLSNVRIIVIKLLVGV